ncbi:MAG: TetR family transcriptional regulator C-terminal domain-containing protein [Alphaproteobacteria bacterium]|nr:TetR family transcriptional regulator C-terminal domain-containing protein [Alphaproteobacteria bacterium]
MPNTQNKAIEISDILPMPPKKRGRPRKSDQAAKGKEEGLRDQKKAAHRNRLIDATIHSIAQNGYAGTTVSTIQEISGLSRGMISLHFSTKEDLFKSALNRLADHYETFWRAALIKAGSKPENQLLSVIENDLSDAVLDSEMLPVWFAFRAESHTHPEYLELYGTRDSHYTQMLQEICLTLAERENKDQDFGLDSAYGIYAMIEGFWVEAFLHPKSFKSKQAVRVIKTFLQSRFPKSYSNII